MYMAYNAELSNLHWHTRIVKKPWWRFRLASINWRNTGEFCLSFRIKKSPPTPPLSYKNIKCYNLQINKYILDKLTIKFFNLIINNDQLNSY